MALFDKRTPAQITADDIVARLETDFRARVSLNNWLIQRLFVEGGGIDKEILAAFGEQGAGVIQYFRDTADFVNTRQPNSIPVDKVDGVTKNPDGTVSSAVDAVNP